jgi:VIT1/CCC1 family predicted Fe2+/Mn2+ transporter
MTIEQQFLRGFNLLARIVGGIFLLGGIIFLASAYITDDLRIPYAVSGVLLTLFGVGLIFVKGAKKEDLERFKRFVEKNSRG